ncbi:hypothetical protein AB0K48_26140 [Nonomuraea sp. NPDC055795]
MNWRVAYDGDTRFGSPGFFDEGSELSLHGKVDLTGAWNGELRPEGAKAQAELTPGDPLELPEGLSKSAALTEGGKVRIKPGPMEVRFTPALSEVMVNNKDPLIDYTSDWAHKYTGAEGDHLSDLQETTTAGGKATFKFVGTGVEYIARREENLGKIQVLLDDRPVTPQQLDPSTTGPRQTQQKLWSWSSAPVDYREHKLEIVNVEGKKAYVDAIKVITGKVAAAPERDKAACRRTSGPDTLDIVIPGTGTPTPTPTGTGTPTSTTTITPTGTSTPTTTPPNNNGDNNQDPWHVGVVPGAVKTPTTRASASPTTTRFIKAQVVKTPKGGVDTGEEPVEATGGPYGLIAGGSALLLVSATGGLLVRRRRAAHAGGAK